MVFVAVGRNYQEEYTIRALAPIASLTQEQYEKAITPFIELASNPKRGSAYAVLLSRATEALGKNETAA